tara:strand:- start:4471 stop:5265 length:795 start_codon:yes stop_codon:yes gene_type:complete
LGAFKKTDVAGLFYSENPKELEVQIFNFLKAEGPLEVPPQIIVAPHAGYIYSGPIAGTAYKALLDLKNRIETVIVLSPAHRYHVKGIAIHSGDGFLTPFGPLKIDDSLRKYFLKTYKEIQILDQAFDMEHGLEVQLPFIWQVFGPKVKIIPLVVGNIDFGFVSSLFDDFISKPNVYPIVSSDLSHFHSYEIACRVDKKTSEIIEEFSHEKLHPDFACGYYSLRGLLDFAKRSELTAKTLDLRNSGDTAGDKNQVVGYGAFGFYK